MTSIKFDILNKLSNDKYLYEIELYECVHSDAIGYRTKMDTVCEILDKITLIDSKIVLVDKYFSDTKSDEENINEDK